MNRGRKHYTSLDMVRFVILGAAVLLVIIAGFSIGLQSLQGTVDLRNNPRINLLIVGIIILASATAWNLKARSKAQRNDSA